jgi:hypothetical protein
MIPLLKMYKRYKCGLEENFAMVPIAKCKEWTRLLVDQRSEYILQFTVLA